MKNILKTTLPIKSRHCIMFFVAILAIIPGLSLGQETTLATKNTEEKRRVSYSFINEYGASYSRQLRPTFWDFSDEIVCVFVNGIRFNNTQQEIGIGIGIGSDIFQIGYSHRPIFLPTYLNYRWSIPTNKTNIKRFVNVACGTQLKIYKGRGFSPWEFSRELYSSIAKGVKLNAFTLSLGATSRVFNVTYTRFLWGVELKVGVAL